MWWRTSATMKVAPYVGAWIETAMTSQIVGQAIVAPYVGAWIETKVQPLTFMLLIGRTLRGCVD